jgi:hypothetical protein
MSAKTEQIVEVIEEVKDKFRSLSSTQPVRSLRLKAIKSIAKRRGITWQSVNDKFIRKLRPDISSLPQFDGLLEKWLIDNLDDLKKILLKHARNSKDRQLVENAFYKAPEPDIALAEEFGFDPNEMVFKEGKEKLRLHLIKERNRHLVAIAKKKWLQQSNGKLRCEVCYFSFVETYGSVGGGFIEAHHKVSISTINADTIVRIEDIVPICSNCHSMLHRHKPWLSIEQLKELLVRRKVN